MIVEMTDNRFFKVREHDDKDLAHLLRGIQVRRVKGGFVPKAGAKEQFVSKAHVWRKIQ